MNSPFRSIQVMLGSRQIGKSTIAYQLIEELKMPVHMASADDAYNASQTWIQAQWSIARQLVRDNGSALLILDEVQKINDWSGVIKQLWDEDTRNKVNLKVLLLGSSTLMLQSGLTESLAGRFEILNIPHWCFDECYDAFDLSIEEYIFYGGYPGALPLKDDWNRFKSYVKDSLIETVISKDILMQVNIKKPPLLRRLFEVGCIYSSQILSYQKIVGQLNDSGNITTLEHYLYLLGQAGLLTSIDKFSVEKVRQRASSPKLMPLNSALFAVCVGKTFEEVKKDHELWGRFVETAVGAHLVNASKADNVEIFYWRDGNYEVDFILRKGDKIIPIEVKSSAKKLSLNGVERFASKFSCHQILIVGGKGIELELFLRKSPAYWFEI
ncbi:MAG: ATP-binding protein [Pseudomonadota bacterium]